MQRPNARSRATPGRSPRGTQDSDPPGIAKGKSDYSEIDTETEAETENDDAINDDKGYLADDQRRNFPKAAPHEVFRNLQTTSKWFPNAYRPPETVSPEEEAKRKRAEFWTRTRWTFAMFLSFLTVIAMGHIYVVALILSLKVGMFKEILGLKRDREKDARIPYFRILNWYFFAICIYFVYGKILHRHIQVVHLENPMIGWVTQNHSFKSFVLWTIGFCTFILHLKKGTYKYQFTQFGWTHVTLLMVVVSASCMINNMYDGMVWFFVPVCLVIWNDVYAYVFGRFWGKTPLIKLSPKKTWEGFIGAFVTTVIFGLWCGYLMGNFEYMICPQEELKFALFPDLRCDREKAFVPSVAIPIPMWLQKLSSLPGIDALRFRSTMHFAPFMWDCLNLSIFASLVAPFGGFFASGFKRAFKIKDFGDLIPGHGGITDRMDCQIIMSVFVTVYRTTFEQLKQGPSVAKILSQVDMLPLDEKKELLSRLQAAVTG